MPAITIKKLETEKDRDDAFEAMTGWSKEEIERCCNEDCVAKATVVVGSRDQLWLCDKCEVLPRFKRHRKLGPIFPWRG
jgi:hypothetical protein